MTWVDESCERVATSTGGSSFDYLTPAGQTTCAVAADGLTWQCADGKTLAVEKVDARAFVVDGVRLNEYDGKLPCGQDGAEWPD